MNNIGTGKIFLSALLISVLLACSNDQSTNKTIQQSVAFEKTDECHLCGMLIGNFPGPKGQLYQHGQQVVRKFCSTRDLFAYLLQPENRHQVTQIYVHDMATSPWETTEKTVLIDARKAWYIAGHNRTGAMGPTLASFARQESAQQFAREYGGRLLRFEDITLELLFSLSTANPS